MSIRHKNRLTQEMLDRDYQGIPKEYADGDGLFFRTTTSNYRAWKYRYTFKGDKNRSFILGKYPNLTLAEARARAALACKILYLGEDPAKHLDAAKSTFNVESFDMLKNHFNNLFLEKDSVPQKAVTLLSDRGSLYRRCQDFEMLLWLGCKESYIMLLNYLKYNSNRIAGFYFEDNDQLKLVLPSSFNNQTLKVKYNDIIVIPRIADKPVYTFAGDEELFNSI